VAGCVRPRPTAQRSDAIRAENAKPGTTDWLLTTVRADANSIYRCPWIEGYCSRTSVRAGDSLDFFVSTNPPSLFVIDLYRLGYYGGRGGRFMTRLGPFSGKVQPDPAVGVERVRECRWQPAATIAIPPGWPSGVYLGKLTAQQSQVQSYVIFIVRDDRSCDFLFQCSDTTWAAYNRWPDFFSLYDDGAPSHDWYVGPGVRVGWDRPYSKYRQIFDAPLSQGSGEFLLWEFPLAFWMEKEGYDVSYISNVDTHADARGLLRARTFLSVGHDEYWSLEMFHHVQAAVAEGVNAAFLSGNSCDGRIEFSATAAGVPNRAFSRIGKFGLRDPEVRRFAGKWKEHGPDPAALMGARSTFPFNGTADWTCVNERHWLFEETGMKNGDSIPGLVGWEHHGEPANIPGLQVLARGPVFSGGRPQGVEYTATIYPGPKGNLVFNAASIWWSIGLSTPPGFLLPSAHGGGPRGPDARVQRITANFFERCRA
jgi:N,N-dimethylformamidase beta subunit-like, C-terminal